MLIESKNMANNIELIIKYLTETATKEECLEFFDWLEASKTNRKEFAQFKAFWIESQATIGTKKGISDSAYIEFENWIKEKEFRLEQSYDKKKRYIQLLKYAASIIVVVSVLSLGYILGTKSIIPNSKQLTTIEAPIGSKSNITLPDGTQIWLNAGSKLTYGEEFNKSSRNVSLDGEAYFDVEKNKKLPFIVKTSHLDLKVLGTSFNVRSYADDNQVNTTLVEGKVTIELKGEKTNETVTLEPNQSLVFYKNEQDRKIISTINKDKNLSFSSKLEKLQPKIISDKIIIHEKADVDGEIMWKEGKLILTEEPLVNLARKIEREYHMDIHFDDPELKKLSYSGTLLLDLPIEQIMNAIKLVSDIDYTIKGQDINLYSLKK